MSAPQHNFPLRQKPGEPPVVPTDKARQGVTGHNVRYVLIVGIAGVAGIFIVLYAIYFH